MLTGVLLHVFDPPRPVDGAADGRTRHQRGGTGPPDEMDHITAVVFVDAFDGGRSE